MIDKYYIGAAAAATDLDPRHIFGLCVKHGIEIHGNAPRFLSDDEIRHIWMGRNDMYFLAGMIIDNAYQIDPFMEDMDTLRNWCGDYVSFSRGRNLDK